MIYLLSHLIENAAQRTPHSEAFRCRGAALTYAELNERSDQLAAQLLAAGVQRGDRVAIYLTKCLEMPVAVYGCLKAGAIYVPVDPKLPRQRLTSVLNNAGVAAILTREQQRPNLLAVCPELNQLPKLIVGLDPAGDIPVPVIRWNDLSAGYRFDPPQLVDDDAAYIIYTSGSTGEPKGIVHTHRSGLSYARLAVETYGVCSGDRLGNFAPLHFDQSTFDFLAGPLAGATTVMIPEEHTRFPASLSQLIEDERLTIWYSVPFALIQLLLRGALDARDLSSLRWVLYGGEAFPLRHLRDLMLQLPSARFSNVYGPAEVNQCTFYHVPEPPPASHTSIAAAGPATSAASIPIGRTWQNTESLIVDEFDQPVAPGQVGELLIRSATAMTGYWNRPELNARAFFDQIRIGTVRRFFRTGDLVQEQPDGNMLFHGRKDRQVKIRGNRVELDEVEAAILTLPTVEKAAAFAVNDSLTQDRQIVVAVIPQSGAALEQTDIATVAVDLLPSYAVPSQVLLTDQFPQTTTGKTDYQVLEQRMYCSQREAAL